MSLLFLCPHWDRTQFLVSVEMNHRSRMHGCRHSVEINRPGKHNELVILEIFLLSESSCILLTFVYFRLLTFSTSSTFPFWLCFNFGGSVANDSGLSRLWPRVQGENWWQHEPDKEDRGKDSIRRRQSGRMRAYTREGVCQPIAHAMWAYRASTVS